jgi:hypothetical protein
MFHHEKKQIGLYQNNKLHGIFDLYATLVELLNMKQPDYRQGISLLSNEAHKYIVIEDHSEFTVRPEQIITQWRFITNTFDFRTNVKEYYYSTGGTPNDMDNALDIIKEYSPTYIDYSKQLSILKLYEKLKDSGKYYISGYKRNSKTGIIIQKFKKGLLLIWYYLKSRMPKK